MTTELGLLADHVAAGKKIRVLLVDDHPIVRQGIRDVLHNTDDIIVCGETANANEAIGLINKEAPDLVIVDIMLDGNVNGIDLVKSLNERFPEINTLVLSMHDESIYAERAIQAGARGYIMKDIAPRNIADAIRTVQNGELYLRNDLSKKILDKMICRSNNPKTGSTDRLTDREFPIRAYSLKVKKVPLKKGSSLNKRLIG